MCCPGWSGSEIHTIGQNGLWLTSSSSCFYLLSASIKGMCHHIQLWIPYIYVYMHIYTYIYICIHLLFIITAPYSFVYLKLIKFYDATWHKSQTIARRNICLLLFNNTYFPANIDLFIYCNILKLAYKVMRSIIRLLYVHCFCWFSSPNLLLKSPLFYWSLFFFS